MRRVVDRRAEFALNTDPRAASGAAVKDMSAITYHRRGSALSRAEREWRVEPDGLATSAGSGERRWAWRDVVSVRLYFDPAPHRPWRHVFELQPRHGRKIRVDNAHFIARRSYEDRSASYAPFVRAALERIAAENPKARALLGETQKRYFFLLLAALVCLGAAAYALIATRTPLDALPYAQAVKFAIVAAMLPAFWLWVIRAMPRGVPLEEIPQRAMPPPAPS